MNPSIENILTDSCQRRVNYLRISVTDRCNLRCRYCAPLIPKQIRKNELLTFEEMYRVVETAVACGITKVRLTGGEPLCRRGVIAWEIEALILETLGKKGREHLLSLTGGPSLKSCMGSIGG